MSRCFSIQTMPDRAPCESGFWLRRTMRDALELPDDTAGYGDCFTAALDSQEARFAEKLRDLMKAPDPRYRYSNQILGHLRFEAIALINEHRKAGRTTLPLLALYVHRHNRRAIRLYERFGFIVEPAATRGDLLLVIQKLPDG